jgi:hypothetical protein
MLTRVFYFPWIVYDSSTNPKFKKLWLSIGHFRHLLYVLIVLQLYWAVEIGKKFRTMVAAPA